MTYTKDERKKEGKTDSIKVYILIENKKHYIDPEIVKKYKLEKEKITSMTGRKLYFEKN